MDEVVITQSAFKLNFWKKVECVEFSPYEWSQHLICIALGQEIIVGAIKFQEEDDAGDEIDYTPIRTFHHETRAHALAWSPETSLSVVPKILTFAVAGADFNIRIYSSNLTDPSECESLEGHTDYINCISYEPEGEILASVSDDHTCKLWMIKEDQKCAATFYLNSPGMSACWHSEEPCKLLVAEKNGLIQMYNIRSQQAIMSLDAGMILLSSADWAPNPLKVVTLTAGQLLLWDVSRPSRPIQTRTLHIEGGSLVKFSPLNDHIIASIGRPDNLLKVTNVRTNQVVLCGQVQLFGGLTWHQRLPYVCAGSDRELRFWRINN